MSMTFFAYCLGEEGMSRERRKDGKERNEEIPPLFYNETRSVFFLRFLYISSMSFYYFTFVLMSTYLNYFTLGCSRRALLYFVLPCST